MCFSAGLRLAGNGGMEKKMETAVGGFRVRGLGLRVWGGNEGMAKHGNYNNGLYYIETTMRIHPFIPSEPITRPVVSRDRRKYGVI